MQSMSKKQVIKSWATQIFAAIKKPEAKWTQATIQIILGIAEIQERKFWSYGSCRLIL